MTEPRWCYGDTLHNTITNYRVMVVCDERPFPGRFPMSGRVKVLILGRNGETSGITGHVTVLPLTGHWDIVE